MGIDRHLLMFVTSHRAPLLTFVARGLMALGVSPVLWAVAALAAALFVVKTRQWRLAIVAGIALGGTYVSAAILKDIIARPRPPSPLSLVQMQGWSMPSTQAAITAASTLAAFQVFDWDRWPVVGRLRTALAILVAAGVGLIGVAMVYLGGHWPSDVVAGWALGVVVGLACARLVRALPSRPTSPG